MFKKFQYLDFKILIPYLLLNIIGIIMILSASSYHLTELGKNPALNGEKQLLFFIISLFLIGIVYKTNLSIYQSSQFQLLIYLVTLILLICTSVLGLGTVAGGAQRWLQIGPLSLQPSELVMLTIILYSAYAFSKKEHLIQHSFLKAVLKPSLIVFSLIGLTLIQPNVGGATILSLIYLILLSASGISYLYIIGGFSSIFILNFVVSKLILFNDGALLPQKYHYIFDRFLILKDPFAFQQGNGLQLVNSYFAIYNGGWLGKGLGNSVQKKGFLPVAETDFIFSITTEELGIGCSILILLLLLFLILRIFTIGMRTQSTFHSLIAIGIGSAILIQTFINLGGLLTIIPLTGVPFPFFSYGGSNLLTLSLMIGLVLNISAHDKKQQEEEQLAISL
ncbi:FtsW/RodA/SpoVE family cell cycle protein [Vagococcus sp.]|uniref:FtsW/RodA/SpoVE family cell cycle protein n=1 Tax=Vagococcus sp. TaxID=1933889 RepID=UPI003F9BCED7